MTTAPIQPHGLLVLDKAGGPTSHSLVAAARRALGTRKVGHAGTLDPMATGLMVLGVGHATRLLTFVVGADKQYRATVRLGVSTTTEDAEGEATGRAAPEALARLDDASIGRAVAALRGEIAQVPSAVSAIKVGGERSYRLVREGRAVELEPRRVRISAFDVLERRDVRASDGSLEAIDLEVRVACSSGTYVRALARDLGDSLGVGAHLTALRRTRVGPFAIDEAASVDDAGLAGRLVPLGEAARRILPALELDHAEAEALGHGKRIRPRSARETATDGAGTPARAAAFAPDGRLVGVVERDGDDWRALMNVPREPCA